MQLLNTVTLYTLIFYPLVATIFITLIPTFDIESKKTLSRFFALLGFATFCRVFLIYLDNKTLSNISYLIKLSNLNIKFEIILNNQNIFMYGIASLSLMANMYLFELNDTKSNIHQAVPFLITFILYICFGQNDLRVALPILSIATFILYFLIGYSDKAKRGSTIFFMGVFLFSVDALALIVLQYQIMGPNTSSPTILASTLAILIPGLSRLCIPLCAPFMRRLFLNVDEAEGPFLMAFLQITGFFILMLARNELEIIQESLSILVGIICVLSSLYISLIATSNFDARTIPYYFLSFYACLVSSLLFFSSEIYFWYLSVSLFITNIVIFFHSTNTYFLILQHRIDPEKKSMMRAIYFLSLSLLVGIPGIGIGSSLWPIIYTLASKSLLSKGKELLNVWFVMFSSWALALILLSLAIVLSLRVELFKRGMREYQNTRENKKTIGRAFFLAPMFVTIICWLIPLATFLAAKK